MNIIDLDVRELEPPEPYRMAVEVLAALPYGSVLNMTHRKEPYPLYPAAAEMGFEHQTHYLSDGTVKIQFWHKDNDNAVTRHA